MYEGYLTDVPGVLVGHAAYEEALTGTTVILFGTGATCSADVRGGGPATRETDLLSPTKMIQSVHAIVLSGGSAFGLEACSGVMGYLSRKKIGFDVGVTHVPIVCGADIFDLNVGRHDVYPDGSLGERAAKEAGQQERRQGNVGAGMGASVGKILGPQYAMKSGIGSASVRVGSLIVSAMVVVNAFGSIYEEKRGIYVAGPYQKEKKAIQNTEALMSQSNKSMGFPTNTSVGVVCTNGDFTKTELKKIAEVSHNGYARSIHPVHTLFDGDVIFAASKGKEKADLNQCMTLAVEAVRRAVINGILSAASLGGLPAYCDIK